ncbi:MAG: hypothetical protein KDA66_18070, partial [Planctomycetaceae bacterium]|nr:hypothetical protein [Planctomycetaceae bacterium]
PAFAAIPDDSTEATTGIGPIAKRIQAAIGKLSKKYDPTPRLPSNDPFSDAVAWTYANVQAALANSPDHHNPELLYLLLISSPNGANLLDQIDADHIGDTDEDGLPEFIDDWGTPIRFYNTPTALFSASGNSNVRIALFPNVTGNTVGAGSLDPLDPTNSLATSGFAYTGGGDPMLYQPIPVGSSYPVGIVYHHLGTYYAPLLVSAGPDQAFGLTSPTNTSGTDRTTILCVPSVPDDTYDNITNHQGAN